MGATGARLILSLFLLGALAGARGMAWGADGEDGRALYLSNCSNCHGVVASSWHRRLDVAPVLLPTRLAVVLPHGPNLTGVVGRPAGTVPDYEYSRPFLAALRGVVWTRATLDRWITDTRAWVPDSIMTYRQPDPIIRARIIDYLAHPSPGPTSMRPEGGDIDRQPSMISSAPHP
jgi:cytochrome c